MLFGHQNDDINQPATVAPTTASAGVNPLAVDPSTGASLPAMAPPPAPIVPADLVQSSVLNQPTTTPAAEEPVTTAPPIGSSPFGSDSAVTPADDPANPSSDPMPFDTPAADSTNSGSVATDVSAPAAVVDSTATAAAGSDILLALKQQALAELSPLVGQLDQTPEERFRTTMMMIQSTDNQSLIQSAYDAAEKITDEKVRAQALLDIINEINYFTQQKPSN